MDMVGMKYYFFEGADDVHDVSSLFDPEVDVYVGYALSDRETEKTDVITSQAIIDCSAAYIVRRDGGEIRSVAVCETTPYLNTLLNVEDSVTVKQYKDTKEATAALLKNEVDAVFVYNYDAEYQVNQTATAGLAYELLPETIVHIRAGVRATNNRNLMSIFSKCYSQISDEDKTSIVSKYLSYSADKLTIGEYFLLHPMSIIAIAVTVMLLVLAVVLLNAAIKEKYNRELEKKVDEITTLNKTLQENQISLEKARMAAERANNAKTSFLFNMSHDIRTPMNAIMGYTDLMKQNIGDVEKCSDYLGKVDNAGRFLLSLINNVLEMAKIESDNATVDEAPFAAKEVVEEVGAVYTELMKKKNIEFVQDIDISTEYIYMDQLKIREILLNLVSNAYKYTREGGTITLAAKELPSDREGYIVIDTVVEDTGIGMSEEFLPIIFERFSREQSYTDNKIEGSGLGLPIVKKLIDLMGGTIEVESELGKGSRFEVRIEHKIAEPPKELSLTDDELEELMFEGKRILLAEDNELNAEIAIEILRRVGLEVERAEDGVECVDMLNKSESGYYDLILMDIQMPNMNGYVATGKIRKLDDKKKANIPIYAMTANAFDEDRQNALNAGMDGHLAKPIDIPELMRILAKELKK